MLDALAAAPAHLGGGGVVVPCQDISIFPLQTLYIANATTS